MRKKIDKKGSALLTVLVVMTVLLVVGMGIVSSATNNLTTTDVVTINERSYYAAEDAAQIAIATIKNEISKYYMTMKDASNDAVYQSLYNNFFNYLSGRLTGENSILSSPDFVESELDGSTTVTCVMDTPTMQASGYYGTTFVVTCVTTLEGISRTVVGKLRVDAAPLDFQWTSAPALSDSVLLLDGNVEVDCEGSENHLSVSGTSKMSGEVLYSCGFSSTDLVENDLTVEDLLTWQLFYDQFDTAISDPAMPYIVTPHTASNKYYFPGSTTITKKVTGKNIYCGGDLVLDNVEVNNCNIYVAGNLFINNTDDPDRLKGTSIYVGGNMFINTSNFWPDGINNMYLYAGGNISIVLGSSGAGHANNSGHIEQAYITAGGNITITSAYTSNDDDIIINSAFKAGGSIEIAGQTYLDNPLIDQISNTTFETTSGDITIVSAYMQSNNKLHAGDDVVIATYGMTSTDIYADDNITVDSSRLYSSSQTQYYSNYCKLAAQDDLTIINSSFRNSYFYAGQNLYLQLTSGYSIRESIMYSEEDAYYDNTWTGNMDTMQSTLIYTNSDFYYSASGTATSSIPAGLQIMSKGNVYSYESDDSPDASDIIIIGEGSYMVFSAIHDMIGEPNSNTGSLAQALADAGFEHTLPEPNVFLPYYTEVYIDEIYE
jgi:Tfp pilus assembly protein PilX